MANFHSKLEESTRALFLNSPRSLKAKHIAKATGLSESWLSGFAKKNSKEYPSGKLEILYEFLTNKKLEF